MLAWGMIRFRLAALAIAATPAPAAAQWTVSPEVSLAGPLGTMGEYLGRGVGFGASIRAGARPLAGTPVPVRVNLRVQARWTHFGTRGVSRPWNGTGAAIGIRSSANVALLTAGPELSAAVGPFRLGASAGAGGATVLATGSTTFAGDPNQVNRSNTWSTTTWAATVSVSASATVARRLQLMIEGSYVQTGRAKFLREYNLPIGYISGIYLNPTPYAPSFAAVSMGVRVRM